MVNPTEFDPASANLDGLTVIEASAGTGKTYAIQKIVARFVREGVPISRMLVMSFTNAAADELSQRIRLELESQRDADGAVSARVECAIADFDLACISTIHGFCQRALREHPMEAGVHGLQGWKLQRDESEAIASVCAEAWSALVEVDAKLSAGIGELREVAAALRAALGSETEYQLLLTCLFAARLAEFGATCKQVLTSTATSLLQSVVENFNADAHQPAAQLLELLEQASRSSDHVETMWMSHDALNDCLESLGDSEKVRGAIPKNTTKAGATKAAAAETLLASKAWGDLMILFDALVVNTKAANDVAAATVARDALQRLLVRRVMLRTLSLNELITRLRDAVLPEDSAMCQVLRDRFDVVIVDEVQDTDPAQAQILRRVFIDSPSHRVILVGDPKQSIYAFRNADVQSYLKLRASSKKPLLRLDCSRRSDPALIQGVQRLFDGQSPFLHAAIPTMDVRSAHASARMHRKVPPAIDASVAGAVFQGEKVVGVDAGDAAGNDAGDTSGQDSGATADQDSVNTVGKPSAGLMIHIGDEPATETKNLLARCANSIAQSLQDGWMIQDGGVQRELQPSDIAVLCNQHWQNQLIARGLRERGVPVVVIDRESVFDSQAAHSIAALLMAASQPRARALSLGAAADQIMGATSMDVLQRPDEWLQRIRVCLHDIEHDGVGLALRRLVREVLENYGRCGILQESDGERFAIDFDHVVQVLEQAEARGVRGARALAVWLSLRVHDQGGRGDESLARSLSGINAVTLMTIHASKGLQFGVTWLPTFMISPSKNNSKRTSSAAEDRRLLYVALTRSKYCTHVVWTPNPAAAASPLAEFIHAPHVADREVIFEFVQGRLADAKKSEQDLAALIARADGAIQAQDLQTHPAPTMSAAAEQQLLSARAMPQIPRRSVVLSFTLLSKVKEFVSVPLRERDVGEPESAVAHNFVQAAGALDAAIRATKLRGVTLGVLVHDALAQPQAFAALAPGADVSPLAQALHHESAGLHVKTLASLDALAIALARGLSAPTGDPQIPSITEIAKNPRNALREISIAVPWKARPADFADILRREPTAWSGAVADVVARTASHELQGLLVGSIDVAALHEGRWYIYDYKTNLCGDIAAAYEGEALDNAMTSALYPFQAAIYSVMLARWVAHRGRSAGAFGESIGGVAYLFLRGMHPESGSRGTWIWHPSLRLIRELHELLPRHQHHSQERP